MDCEAKRRHDRIRLHELMIEHPEWTNTAYAEEIGRNLGWVKDWKERLAGKPLKEDFTIYESKSRTPKTIWRETPEIVKDVICELREELSVLYHRTAGPKTILPYLRKREDLKDAGHFVPNSVRTVARILHERGYIQSWKPRWREPMKLAAPMQEWEMDFGLLVLPDDTRFEFFAIIDCGTSRVIHLAASEGFNAETVLLEVAKVLLTHGCPRLLRFDRDPRFVGSWTRDSFSSAMVKFLKVMGVTPDICPPRKPWKKPYVERLIYTIKYEWLLDHSFDTAADLYDLLPPFLDFYHSERIHQGKACNGRTPDEAFPSLPQLPHPPEIVQPNSWLEDDHGRVFRRRVTGNGTIQIDREVYYIGMEFTKQTVHVHLDAPNRRFVVMLDYEVIKTMPIRGLLDDTLDFQVYLLEISLEARSTEQHRRRSWMRYGEGA